MTKTDLLARILDLVDAYNAEVSQPLPFSPETSPMPPQNVHHPKLDRLP